MLLFLAYVKESGVKRTLRGCKSKANREIIYARDCAQTVFFFNYNFIREPIRTERIIHVALSTLSIYKIRNDRRFMRRLILREECEV